MDFLTIYSISLLGLPLAAITLIRVSRFMRAWLPLVYRAFLRYLLCRAITDRHRLLSPISRARLLSLTVLLGCVVAGSVVEVADLRSAAVRAGRLSILLSVPLFASSHFGGLSNALGTALARIKLLHTAIGWMALFEAVFHTAASTQDASSSLAQRKGLFGLIVRLLRRPITSSMADRLL